MCGILGKISKDGRPVNGSIIYNYIQQRNRGTQGFGFAYKNDNNRIVMRHHVGEAGIIKELNRYKSDSILFHHRIPTSTANVERGCHPYKATIFGRSLYVIHNGVLNNEDTLYDDHSKKGYDYRSLAPSSSESYLEFNDSEALTWDLAEVIFGIKTELTARGSIAFIAFETDTSNNLVKMHYGRNAGSPLCKVEGKRSILLGSEVEGESIPSDVLFTYDVKTKKSISKKFMIPFGYSYLSAKAQGADSAHNKQSWDSWIADDDGYGDPTNPGNYAGAYPRTDTTITVGSARTVITKTKWKKASEIAIDSTARNLNVGDRKLFIIAELTDRELQEELSEVGLSIDYLESLSNTMPIDKIEEWQEYYDELNWELDWRVMNVDTFTFTSDTPLLSA